MSTHHPRPVVYAELYFLYFIFLTEFSSTAVCVTPASASMAVEKSTADFYTAFQLDTVLLSRKKDIMTSMIPRLAPAQCWFVLEEEMLFYATRG